MVREQPLDLIVGEAGQRQVEIGQPELPQLQCEQVVVPLGPGRRAIGQQPEGSDLAVGEFVREDDRDRRQAQPPRCLEPQVAIDQFPVLLATTGMRKPNSVITAAIWSMA